MNFKAVFEVITYIHDFDYAYENGFWLDCERCRHPILINERGFHEGAGTTTPKCRQCMVELRPPTPTKWNDHPSVISWKPGLEPALISHSWG